MCTNCYADQFGGPKGKKYIYENLNQKLAKINGYDPMKQRVELSHEFTYRKGALEQVEDVCVLGIRI